MGELIGVLAAMLSGGLGGGSVGATRFVIGATDPLTLGAFRFGIGSLMLLPFALLGRSRWPDGRALPAVATLGLLYFALFPILFNAALALTTAARGALALSTLPLLTMLAAALLGVEPLTKRKSIGVLVAMAGVALALVAGLAGAPSGAWRGDLLMVTAALCMALYSIWSRPFVQRSGTIPYTIAGMVIGAVCLTIISWAQDGFDAAASFGPAQWAAVLYLGVCGGALTFYLWSFALERTTPTRVAISVTVNPIAAALFGAVVLGEPITWNLVAGLATVLAGIWLATSKPRVRRKADELCTLGKRC